MTNTSNLDIFKLFDCDETSPHHYLKLAEVSARNGLIEDCNVYLLIAETFNQVREYDQLNIYGSRKTVSHIIQADEFYKQRSKILNLLEIKLENLNKN